MYNTHGCLGCVDQDGTEKHQCSSFNSIRLSRWMYRQLEERNIDFANSRKGRDRDMFLADYLELEAIHVFLLVLSGTTAQDRSTHVQIGSGYTQVIIL